MALDILMITPGSRTNTMRMPLGLMSLSSSLDKAGISNGILDIKADPRANETNVREVARLKPKVVGVTAVATEIFEIRDLCRDIRQVSPKTKILLGGPGPSYRPDHFVTAGVPCDFMLLGEADLTIVPAMQAILNGGSIHDAPGGYSITDPELAQKCAHREMVDDLSVLEYPAYDKVNMDFYCQPSVWAIRFVYLSGLSIMTSRGCPYTCKFCVVPNIYGRQIRVRTPEQVVTQVRFLKHRYGIDALFWFDEVFTGNKKWAREVCRLLKEADLGLVWGCQTRAHLIDAPLLKEMKAAGCVQIDTGYESGSDRMLDVIDKGVKATSELYLKFAATTHEAGIRHLANMMINLPTETMADVDMSVAFIKKAKPNVVLWGPYIPIPGISFGHEMSLEDMDIYGEQRAEAAVLEDKYKYATYAMPLKAVLHRIRRAFPYPSDPSLSLNPMYYWRWLKYFSYFFTIWYWRVVFKSSRRSQYLRVDRMLAQKVRR